MNKRGQFFLASAIIIVGVIISFTSLVNSVEVGNDGEAFYDLSSEVGFETKKVLDYGVFNPPLNPANMEDFLDNYANYLGEELAVFVYGDATSLHALYFQETGGSVGITTDPQQITTSGITITTIEQGTAQVSVSPPPQQIVSVVVNGVTYEFKLRDGNNFFFVLQREENGEKFVAAN